MPDRVSGLEAADTTTIHTHIKQHPLHRGTDAGVKHLALFRQRYRKATVLSTIPLLWHTDFV